MKKTTYLAPNAEFVRLSTDTDILNASPIPVDVEDGYRFNYGNRFTF